MPTLRSIVVLITIVLSQSIAQAKPSHKKALADYFGPQLAATLNNCSTCHLPASGPTEELTDKDKPHNPYGVRLKEVASDLKRAGKPTDIVARIEAIVEEDSDGDGIPNLVELLAGHSPGDSADRPTTTEVVDARKRASAFMQLKQAWKPFEKVSRPAIPAVQNTGWVRNPIDAFLAIEHEARSLKPRPEANRATLLRRVYLDLIGLPPTPDELHAFLADQSTDAYEKVVDRLLKDPRHGERWGRHWMDVWRYADWAGYGAQIRDSQPHLWHWRDWIVESLNKDKGYDRMVLEMLAADELAPDDTDTLRATGFLVRNFKLLSREKWLEDTLEHTSQAFLGVTLACARCHDHMFDPITQKEYYQVRAIFEPHKVRIDRVPGQADIKKDGLPRVYDADLAVPTYLFIRGDDRTPDKSPLSAGVPEAIGGKYKVEPVSLPANAYAPFKRDFELAEDLAAATTKIETSQKKLQETQRLEPKPDTIGVLELDLKIAENERAALVAIVEAEKLEEAGQKDSDAWKKVATEASVAQRKLAVAQSRRAVETAKKGEKTKADPTKKVEAAEKALAKAEADEKLPPTTSYTPRSQTLYPKTSTGRRLAFARWIADRDNPLTARVAMNHIWLRHFGQAIVPSVFDFGRNGRPPSHPALLNWLAAEFTEHNYSMKHMHRLLVTSNAYRMASTPDEANMDRDRDNVYLWRMPPRRLEAEVVRDCVFYVAGKLDQKMGGADIPHAQGLTTPRRSIYFQHAQEKQMEFLKIFDGAPVSECYQRNGNVLPQQALALANSELTRSHARVLAETLAKKTGGDQMAFTIAAFESVLSRPPTDVERSECVEYLKLRPRESLVHVLMNHHEFVTVR